MPSKNIAPKTLLLAIADLVEEFPELHDQEHWETKPEDNTCGTRACIAGWACILGTNDFKQKEMIVGDADKPGIFWIPKKRVVRDHGYMDADYVEKMTPGERIEHLPTDYYAGTGAELLGLDGSDADLLFHGEGRPRNGLSVSEALRAIANGTPVEDVWADNDYDEDEDSMWDDDGSSCDCCD